LAGKIRKAHREDCAFILRLIKELAIFEKAPEKVSLSLQQLQADGFSEKPLFQASIIQWNNIKVGFYLYYFRYSTWKGKSLYLEDLFVLPEYRRRGLARMAFVELSKVAQIEKCGRFEWQVLDWNEGAISFYQSFQTELDSEWINCRLEGDNIKNPQGFIKDNQS